MQRKSAGQHDLSNERTCTCTCTCTHVAGCYMYMYVHVREHALYMFAPVYCTKMQHLHLEYHGTLSQQFNAKLHIKNFTLGIK